MTTEKIPGDGSLKDFKFSTPPRCIEAEQKKRREHLIAALGLDPYYMDEGVQRKTGEQRAILRERLADCVHKSWSGWMQHLFERAVVIVNRDDGCNWTAIARPDRDRWACQMETPYAELSEDEKDSDRAQADRILAILCGGI